MNPIDLSAAWEEHVSAILSERDDGSVLHASDLQSCDFALWQRLHGIPQLHHDDKSFANFERGHAYESRAKMALEAYVNAPVDAQTLVFEGIEGNPDFVVQSAGGPIVIDVTTSAKGTDWDYGHALKSAFYAVALDARIFCEWVFHIGFAGNIVGQRPHWFRTEDWRDDVLGKIALKKALQAAEEAPPAQPPYNPRTLERETWRCEKGYCRARCDFNSRFKPL